MAIDQNIVGKLYGVPYFLGYHEDRKNRRSIGPDDLEIPMNLLSNFIVELDETVQARIKSLKDEEQKNRKDMHWTADRVKRATNALFKGKKLTLKSFLKAANDKEHLELEEKIYNFAYAIVLEAFNQNQQKGGKLKFSPGKINSFYAIPGVQQSLQEAVQAIETMFGTGKGKDIENALKNLISTELLSEKSNLVVYTSTNSKTGKTSITKGTPGELTALISMITNKKISKDLDSLLKNFSNTKGVGGSGGKIDTTTLGLSFSVKTYASPNDISFLQQDEIDFRIHTGPKLNNFFQQIRDAIDPEFLKDNKEMARLTTLWVNSSYLYNYGYKDEDREVRDIIGQLLKFYGIAYLVGGTKNQKGRTRTYYSQVKKILSQVNDDAFFLYLPGHGVIPMYSILETIAQEADDNEKGISFRVVINSKAGKDAVDRLDASNGWIFDYKSSLRFNGDKDKISNLLKQRYAVFTKEMGSSTIEMSISGGDLGNLLAKSAGRIA